MTYNSTLPENLRNCRDFSKTRKPRELICKMPSAIFWAKFLKNSSASSGKKWSYELSHARRILDCFQLAIIRREIFCRLLWKAITLNILFTRRYVFAMSNGIDEPGAIRAPLAASLLLAWSAVFCCLYKGIKSFGKVCADSLHLWLNLSYVAFLAIHVRRHSYWNLSLVSIRLD